jgi:5-formyltetrahydrofolate cyclo-ligase
VNVGLTQEQIRKQIQQRRQALTSQEVAELSQEVISRFLAVFPRISEIRVGMYRALPMELNLKDLEFQLRAWGWKLHFPRISDRNLKNMEFVEVSCAQENDLAWKIGPYGIQEPHPELKAVSPQKLDLIFIPSVALSESGQRIGMGAGYYDRFLEKLPLALRVGLIYDFQLFSGFEQKAWDQPVHWVMTESKEFKSPFVSQWLKTKGVLS